MATALAARTDQDEQLTGRQKVAILCMAMGADATAKITAKLTSDEIEQVSYEIARMDRVPMDTVHAAARKGTRLMRNLATGTAEACAPQPPPATARGLTPALSFGGLFQVTPAMRASNSLTLGARPDDSAFAPVCFNA